MAADWQELTRMTGGRPFVVERVRLVRSDVRIEGEFELPQLAGLAAEDQVFVATFVRSHGSIKAMEELFGISYPTVKNRLNRIGSLLELVRIDRAASRMDLLDRLERGEISVKEAVDSLERGEEP